MDLTDLTGKILVLVVFGLSLMMAAIGGAALYYRVDWSNNPPPAADQPAGELVERIQKLNDIRAYVAPANIAWRDARSALLAQEERRQADEAWYATALEYLRTGDVDAAKKPIMQVVYDKGATKPDAKVGVQMTGSVDSKGAPAPGVLDRFDQPLKSLAFYTIQMAKVTEDDRAVLVKIAQSEEEDKKLTIRLIGTDNPNDVLPAGEKPVRGLIKRTKAEADKQDEIAKEMELVTLAEGQVRADSQLLLLRKKALQARIQELGKPAPP